VAPALPGAGLGHLPDLPRTPAWTLERARAAAREKFIAAKNPQTPAKSRCTAKSFFWNEITIAGGAGQP
jgi:hypothetical protein